MGGNPSTLSLHTGQLAALREGRDEIIKLKTFLGLAKFATKSPQRILKDNTRNHSGLVLPPFGRVRVCMIQKIIENLCTSAIRN